MHNIMTDHCNLQSFWSHTSAYNMNTNLYTVVTFYQDDLYRLHISKESS